MRRLQASPVAPGAPVHPGRTQGRHCGCPKPHRHPLSHSSSAAPAHSAKLRRQVRGASRGQVVCGAGARLIAASDAASICAQRQRQRTSGGRQACTRRVCRVLGMCACAAGHPRRHAHRGNGRSAARRRSPAPAPNRPPQGAAAHSGGGKAPRRMLPAALAPPAVCSNHHAGRFCCSAGSLLQGGPHCSCSPGGAACGLRSWQARPGKERR